MRFIVDAQLPPALARMLTDMGHVAEHVADIGLVEASDVAIWRFAALHGAVIVTKDEDFSMQRLRSGRNPAVVWLRVGNCSRAELMRWFLPLLPRVIELIEAGDGVVEVR